MIRKMMQIYYDHKAMEVFRRHHADLHLVSYCGMGDGFEAYIFQHEWHRDDHDPSRAILKAYKHWKDVYEGK